MKELALAVGLALLGCKSQTATDARTDSPSSARPADGKERGNCLDGKPVGTCDPGLVCLSNLCVRPPPGDCSQIADHLTSLDLGNYATPDARQPVAAAYRQACETALVSKDQGECIVGARNKFSASRCAPLMFPELSLDPAKAAAECAAAIAAEREVMKQSAMGTDERSIKMFEVMLATLQESCVQDSWPASLIACVKSATDVGSLQRCNNQIAPDLQTKITDRGQKAMIELQRTLRPPPTADDHIH